MVKAVESAIQRAVVGWTHEHYPYVQIAAFNNEFARHRVGRGVVVGIPDLILFMRQGRTAHFLFLELKKKKGKLSPAQIEWNYDFDERYVADNCSRDVAYGFMQAREKITQWVEGVRGAYRARL